jgi:hypothetical protein
VIDIDHKVDEAGKEEEHGGMEKCWKASTARGRPNCSTPSAKKVRMRARLYGTYQRSVTWMYLRTDCCMSIAKSAHVKLSTMLMNQADRAAHSPVPLCLHVNAIA